MKINLECGTDIRNGYLNVNFGPVAFDNLQEGTRFVIGNYKNLDPIVKDGEADEIVFNPPLNRIVPAESGGIMAHWCKKLRPGGKLLISFYDIRRVGRLAHSGEMNLLDIHNIIFGANGENRMVVDTEAAKAVAEATGYSVELVSSVEFVVTIELKKNVVTN